MGRVFSHSKAGDGFTLLEVLVALAIMATALVALHQGFSTVLRARLNTVDLQRVMTHAHNEIMQLERSSASIISQAGTYDEEHPLAGMKWSRKVELRELIPGLQLRYVELEWNWQNGSQSQSYRSEVLLPNL